MQCYTIYSNYCGIKGNDFYRIDESGNVLETPNGKMQPDIHEWRITGVWYNKGYGHIGFIPLSEMLKLSDAQLNLKDGRPRYGLTDIDHGTHRIHGNKDVHGVKWIIPERA